MFAAFAHDDRGAGVLAHWQDAAGRDIRILEQVQCNKAVIGAGLWVGQNRSKLLEVSWAQQVRDVFDGLKGQKA